MVKNVPYFKNLDDHIADEIVYKLRPKRYESGNVIVKRGDNVDSIMFLKTGEIEVYVPGKQ